ncbi:unnamed protein product [Schistosoma mattheei]|uniref:Uncharacterized protein n=1 Tax=Schistosoma mattheei TaxID=31246 RepID=A0A183PLZ7_9TREM|nr:unnamed protein product [Schistosoma mattheei]
MDCEVSGHPQPTVVWLKNEIPIQTTDKRITFVAELCQEEVECFILSL